MISVVERGDAVSVSLAKRKIFAVFSELDDTGKWHGIYGVPVPETGRTSSSELIKNRAELNESDIRVNKIETKDGQDKSCWKKQ
ncbi:hypothetical protein TNCV_1196201 [Trichonephila clavipes]|uniref:Uncharacterized protein n=1 Tax=Trichonephila clavipes TaxID=2585209 RepID=A0A8X6S3C3_TRICX|nr:hypothetical protein TNCV_1196201 [Trichonephila clavipes]